MGDASSLPALTPTVDLEGGGSPIQGDPLQFMQQKARENIDLVNKNLITKDEEKLEFKREVLKRLKTNIQKFNEIEAKFTAQKKQEEVVESEVEGSGEKDPFADIFGGGGQADEATQEKMAIAQEFASTLKIFKADFLKKIRIKREAEAKVHEEKEMAKILGQLEDVNRENNTGNKAN